MKQQTINMATINCHAQTKMTLAKQLQIDQLLAQYDLDILFCQETAIIDGTFKECKNVMNNYKIIYNNANNDYGTSNYQTPQDAEQALDRLNFELLNGRPMRIMWSQRDPSVRKSGVGNVINKLM